MTLRDIIRDRRVDRRQTLHGRQDDSGGTRFVLTAPADLPSGGTLYLCVRVFRHKARIMAEYAVWHLAESWRTQTYG